MFLWAPSLSFDFQVLPLSPKFFPPLTIRVKDNRQFGSRPTVGQRTISDASKYWINSTKNDAKAAEQLLEPVAGHNRFYFSFENSRVSTTGKSQGKPGKVRENFFKFCRYYWSILSIAKISENSEASLKNKFSYRMTLSMVMTLCPIYERQSYIEFPRFLNISK